MNSPEKYHFQNFTRLFSDEDDDGLTKWLKSISFLSALVALLIFTDYFLPLTEKTHTIKNLIVRNGFEDIGYDHFLNSGDRSGEEEFWMMMEDEEIAVTEIILSNQKINDEIRLYKTPIFGINVKFQNTKFYPPDFSYPYFNVYGFLLIIPCIFLMFFILMRIFGKKSEVVLSIGVLNIFLLVGFGVLLLFY